MKITYDVRYDVAYIRLREKQTGVETIRLSDEVNVDLAPDGTVCGIELLNAKAQLVREDAGKILVIDEGSGKRHEVPLAG
jgi:uncharacterized protein YuzE